MKSLIPTLFFILMSIISFGQTIADIVVGSPDHNILETAVIEAELDDDLASPGPFTLFAPTDAAFNALPSGTLNELLMDPTGELAQILLYHVLGAEVLSTDLSDGQTATTLQGKDITVTIDGSDVFINDAQVTVVDIMASNGVVHVIDAVLLPPLPSVVEIIVESPDHMTLETAVIAAELDDDLSGDGPFTVFAPTDAAFDALPAGTVEELLMDPTGELAQILLYHVLGAEVLSTDLSDGQTATTLQGKDITVTIDGSDVFINDAQVTVVDIMASNGVVHVIDAVLLPPVSTTNISAKDGNITISPNPASDYIQIVFPSTIDGEKWIQLFDLNGKLIESRIETGISTDWYLNNVSNGMYFLRIDTQASSYYDKLFINK